MSSFTHEESEIIRDADMDWTLKQRFLSDYYSQLLDSVDEFGDEPVHANHELASGRIGRDLILLCAKLDLDLTTCIRKARQQ